MLTSCVATTMADISKGFKKELICNRILVLDITQGFFPVAGCKVIARIVSILSGQHLIINGFVIECEGKAKHKMGS